jgi:hypothetical protein
MVRQEDLKQLPLIPVPILARNFDVASAAIMAAARRAGIEPEQQLNGHRQLTFVQAEAVLAELTK